MKHYKLLLLCIYAILPHALKAQFNAPMRGLPTPQAASLGVFNEIPVNGFTGAPNINIPLCDFQNKDISIPISLSYHIASVRPSLHPSWVGQGWSLSAGGCITRKVNGYHDESQRCDDNKTETGYFGNYSKLNKSNWFSAANIDRYLLDASNGNEAIPDEFSFNFCGYSGSFYLDHTGNWQVHSDADIKVVFDKNTDCICISDLRDNMMHGVRNYEAQVVNYRMINTITLVTPDGIQYKFGGKDATEYSIPYFNQIKGLLVATSWYLSEIISPNGNTMTLTYEPGDPIFETTPVYGSLTAPGHTSGSLVRNQHESMEVIVMFPVYLSKITINENRYIAFSSSTTDTYYKLYPGNEVDCLKKCREFFQINNPALYDKYLQSLYYEKADTIKSHSIFIDSRSPYDDFKWRKLNYILVSDGAVYRQIFFTYNINDYNPTSRLRLDAVLDHPLNESSSDIQQRYTFSYYGIKDFWPAYYTDQEDHWGFYNGRSELSGRIDIDAYYNQREPSSDLNVRISRILSDIYYPTGKKTHFEYEKNDYSQYVDAQNNTRDYNGDRINQTGGIRIKNIVDSYNGKLTGSRQYYYFNNFNSLSDTLKNRDSSGILAKVPNYKATFTLNIIGEGDVTFNLFSSGTISPYLHNISGSHIGYSNVTEVMKDGNGNIMGYKKYNFSNLGTDRWGVNHNDELPLARMPFSDYRMNHLSDKSFERGRLLCEEYYSADSKLKKQVLYKYSKSPGQDYVRGLSYCYYFLQTRLIDQKDKMLLLMDGYKLYTCAYKLTEKREITYGETMNSNMEIIENYNYNHYLYSESRTVGRGKKKEITYKYPKDYSTNFVCRQMVAKNIVTPIETRTELKGSDGMSVFLQRELFSYDIYNNIPYLSSYQKAIKNVSNLTDYYRCYKTDMKGNPVYVSFKGEPKTVYLWSDDYNYPVAEIKNATYDQVQAASPDKNNLSGLYDALPKAQITLYDYTANGLKKQEQNMRRMSTYYRYNTRGWLTKILDNRSSTIEKYEYGFKR